MYVIAWVIYKRYCQDIEYIISDLWATEKVQFLWKLKKRQYIKYNEIIFSKKIRKL